MSDAIQKFLSENVKVETATFEDVYVMVYTVPITVLRQINFMYGLSRKSLTLVKIIESTKIPTQLYETFKSYSRQHLGFQFWLMRDNQILIHHVLADTTTLPKDDDSYDIQNHVSTPNVEKMKAVPFWFWLEAGKPKNSSNFQETLFQILKEMNEPIYVDDLTKMLCERLNEDVLPQKIGVELSRLGIRVERRYIHADKKLRRQIVTPKSMILLIIAEQPT